ncbi:MAG: response regulator transcription factor [Treponema sp.]|nr:response regulator transcription factor [Treponema sp.]
MQRIVIVEDHPVMRKGLAAYFNETGRWHVTGSASNLAAAKELLIKNDTDVLLLDIQLDNRLDADSADWGLDIIPWLRELKKNPLPLLAVYSTFDDYAHVSSALSLGVKAYVTKRCNESELEKALLKALNGEIYIDEAAKMKLQQVTTFSCLLTKREAEILNLVKKGLSNKEIAGSLGINHRTVQNILSCIYDKTGIKSRQELERL